MSGHVSAPRPVATTTPIMEQLQRGLATMGQVIARLAETQGGSWRVVECATCLHDNKQVRLLEITLPVGPTFLVALGDDDVISGGRVERLETPPTNNATPETLLAWVQGISVPALETP